MDNNPGLLILAGAIVGLFILTTKGGRLLAVVAILIIAALAAKNLFVREISCPRTNEACFEAVQKTIYGPCAASEGSGLLRIDGTYFLTAQAGVAASATCLSLAVWR